MKFSESVNLINEYRTWRIQENKNHDFKIPYNPETFVSFLEIKGYEVVKKEEDNETGHQKN